jgi:hypothetical protein
MRGCPYLASCAGAIALASSCTSKEPQAVLGRDTGAQGSPEVGQGEDVSVAEGGATDSPGHDNTVPSDAGVDATEANSSGPTDAEPSAASANVSLQNCGYQNAMYQPEGVVVLYWNYGTSTDTYKNAVLHFEERRKRLRERGNKRGLQ